MEKRSFVAWQTWEKLVFILACAIVFTVILGSIKLRCEQRRLRKYLTVVERGREEEAQQRQMSQWHEQRPPETTQTSDDVPFGIRAIESGIEIDGVWISRTNTPEPVYHTSAGCSSIWNHVTCKQQEVDIEKQMPLRTYDRSASKSIRCMARPATSAFDRAVSAERLPNVQTSNDPAPDIHIPSPLRSRHPPCSYTRFSNTPYVHQRTSTTSTLDGLEAIRKASTEIHEDGSPGDSDSSKRSTQSDSDFEPISASAPRLLNNQPVPRPRPREKSSDIDLMDSHRVSQVAETGQLTPRVRRRRQGGDWSNMTASTSGPTREEQMDNFINRHELQPTPPESRSGSPTKSFATPKVAALPPGVRRSSMPDVTPFAQFCLTAPPSPRVDGRKPPSISGLRLTTHKRSGIDLASIYVSAPASALEPVHVIPTIPPQLAQSLPGRTSFEKQESQVIRGQGTGFEIMKPGTFNAPPPAEHPMERQKATPPFPLHNAYRPRSSSADSRSRLQKKRRPSMESQLSFEGERKRRNSICEESHGRV